MTEVFRYDEKYRYSILEENKAEAEAYIERLNKVKEKFRKGELYIRFIDGDREGSIAKFTPNAKYNASALDDAWLSSRQSGWWSIERGSLYGECSWNGRRNIVQEIFPSPYIEILIDYTGDTKWEKFDAKAAKAELLKNPDQTDINGAVISVGDRVLYINARYGSRVRLEYGTVVSFKAQVNSQEYSISTIVANGAGEESEMNYTHDMLVKI